MTAWCDDTVVRRVFANLHQPLLIRPRYDNNVNQNVLPEASTCSRELFLPAYHTLSKMREKVLAALEFASLGFDRV